MTIKIIKKKGFSVTDTTSGNLGTRVFTADQVKPTDIFLVEAGGKTTKHHNKVSALTQTYELHLNALKNCMNGIHVHSNSGHKELTNRMAKLKTTHTQIMKEIQKSTEKAAMNAKV